MEGYMLVAVSILIFAFIIYIIFAKFKNGVITFFNSGLHSHGEFADFIIALAAHISKKRKEIEEYNPRLYVGDERWLLDSQGPKTFYFLDEIQVDDFYYQINQPQLSEYSEREKLTGGMEGGVNLNPISLKGHKGHEAEKTSKFHIESSIASRYSIIENYLKDNQLLRYGIAQFYTDELQRQKFYDTCDNLEKEFNYKITEEERLKHWINLNKENAYPTLEEIKLITGTLVLQQDFDTEIENDQLYLSFIHPINEYLEEKDRDVKICIYCSKEKLTHSGKIFIIPGKTIKATCIGKVIRWDGQRKSLDINPIAIF